MSQKPPVLTFNNHEYIIETLRNSINGMPRICIKSEELDANFLAAVALPESFNDDQKQIVLYSYNGKYFVLMGLSKVKAMLVPKKDEHGQELPLESVNITGRLATKHVLKRAQYVPITSQTASQDVTDFSAAPQGRYGDRGDRAPYRRQGEYSDNRFDTRQRRW